MTKGELIGDAFAELGLAAHVYDLEPDEQQTALRRMDAMLSFWESRGIRIGYVQGADLGAESGLPQYAHEAVIAGLAMRLAPGFGKQISAQTAAIAKAGYDELLKRAAFPPEQQLKSLPAGAGNRSDVAPVPFLPEPTSDPLGTTPGGDLSFLGA